MPSVIDRLIVDWAAFWQKANPHFAWDLEWFDGANWVSAKSDLAIQKNYLREDTCKIKLIFNASKAGNYRLTFAVDSRVRDYVARTDKYLYELNYGDYSIVFDWSDVTGIPNLAITHGFKDGFFWFRMRKDNVPEGARVEIDPSIVGTATSMYATRYPNMRKTFRAAGRFWAWFSDGTNLVYSSSADGGLPWLTPVSVGACTDGIYGSAYFDGTHVHYARWNYDGVNYALFYRCGTPNSDGSITWLAAEQTVQTSTDYPYDYIPMISADSSGYAWIGVRRRTAALTAYPYVYRNANNDGTWSTASGFPYRPTVVDSLSWTVTVVALTSQKVYVLYARSGYKVSGRLYDAGWGSAETASSSNIQSGEYHSASADGDTVHLMYLVSNTYEIQYRIRTTSWQTEENVTTTQLDKPPALSIDLATGDLYCFWLALPTANHVYYKARIDGAWGSIVDWVDESADGFPLNSIQTCSIQAYDGYIGLLYVTKAGSPFDVKYAVLDLNPPGLAVIVTNEDLSTHFGFEWDEIIYTATVLDENDDKLPASFVVNLRLEGVPVVVDQALNSSVYSQSTGLLTLVWYVPSGLGAETVDLQWAEQTI